LTSNFSRWQWIFAALSGLYLLGPLLTTSYISDDSYNSLMHGQLLHNGLGLWEFMYSGIDYWLFKAGRIFPLPNYYVPLYYFLQSLLIYKALTVLVALASVAAFAWFLTLISGAPGIAPLAFILVPILFQLRAWHDPLLAFHFFTPLLAIFLMLAFTFFQRYLLSNETRLSDRRWSAGFFFLAMMTYEVGQTCVVFFPLLALMHSRSIRRALRSALPHITLFLGVLAATCLLRSPLNPRYMNSYQVVAKFDLKNALLATTMQVSASFPLSYFFKTKPPLKDWFAPTDFLFFPLYFSVVYTLIKRFGGGQGARTLVVIGLPLTLGMGIIGGFSSHQQEIRGVGWGMGYLPVFIGYFGVGMLLAGLGLALHARCTASRARKGLAILMAGLLTGAAFCNLVQSRWTAHQANMFYKFPRDVVVSALQSGLLDDVPQDATIVVNARFPIDHFWGFSQYLNKRVFTKSPTDLFANQHGSQPIVENVSARNMYGFTYQYDHQKGRTGTAYAGKITEVVYDPQKKAVVALNLQELRLYDFQTKRTKIIKPNEAPVNLLLIMNHADEAPASITDFPANDFLDTLQRR
jgi:hypothetical protein